MQENQIPIYLAINPLPLKVSIDGEEYNAPDHMMYNSVMLDDVPNFAFVVGYTNASWTLKVVFPNFEIYCADSTLRLKWM